MNPSPTKPTTRPLAPSPVAHPERARSSTPSAKPPAQPTRQAQSGASGTTPAPEHAATAAPVAAPKTVAGPAAADGASAGRRRKMILIGAGAVGVLTLGVVMYTAIFRTVEAPRLNSEPYLIGKFTATRSFDRMDFSKKWQYYELLDDKEDALKAAYAQGKMTDDEYRTARQAAWYGKHLGRMRNYF
jgi:hypothetical protein